ncbi:MAG: hypothetical protein JSV27_04410 [Candidatus Bathyarchaeota archaeon]|nr:MAG: hypothetical protein JSV27_04410 [Candidatus Bathyarchaeota archaeon]
MDFARLRSTRARIGDHVYMIIRERPLLLNNRTEVDMPSTRSDGARAAFSFEAIKQYTGLSVWKKED